MLLQATITPHNSSLRCILVLFPYPWHDSTGTSEFTSNMSILDELQSIMRPLAFHNAWDAIWLHPFCMASIWVQTNSQAGDDQVSCLGFLSFSLPQKVLPDAALTHSAQPMKLHLIVSRPVSARTLKPGQF